VTDTVDPRQERRFSGTMDPVSKGLTWPPLATWPGMLDEVEQGLS